MDSDCRRKGCGAAHSSPSVSFCFLLCLVEEVMLRVVEVMILLGMSTFLWEYQGRPGFQ